MRTSLLALATLSVAFAQSGNIVVRPAEIPDVLVNPGMGIQTFQRFNGDAINPGTRWSEVGPEAKLNPTAGKPDFPRVPSRISAGSGRRSSRSAASIGGTSSTPPWPRPASTIKN